MVDTTRMVRVSLLLAGLLALVAVAVAAPNYAIKILPDGTVRLRPDTGAPRDPIGYFFGKSVSVDGNTVVVGANRMDGIRGRAFVYERVDGTWRQVAELVASDGTPNDAFGASVSIDGDTIVVGAFNDNANGFGSGSAYVYTRENGTWPVTQTVKLRASDAAAGDRFGEMVRVKGDTIVIAARADNDFTGSAYVYTRTNGTWPQTQTVKLRASDGAASDNLGWSLDASANTIVVGARGDSNFAGSAYVFERTGGTWPQTESAKLVALDFASATFFGDAVGVDGNTVAVTAEGDGVFVNVVYVFERTEDGWQPVDKLAVSDRAKRDTVATSVYMDGSTMVAGVPSDADFAGSAYVFERTNGNWRQTQTLKLDSGEREPRDFWGTSVSVDGELIVIGALGDENDTIIDDGSAFVYKLAKPPTILAVGPGVGEGGVDPNTNLSITFSKNVFADAGSITLKRPDGTVIETIPADSPRVTIDGATVTIDPATLLTYSTDYAVDIDPGAFVDADGNPFVGLSN